MLTKNVTTNTIDTLETLETGATMHCVNELVLYTDNSSELAEYRNDLYKELEEKLAQKRITLKQVRNTSFLYKHFEPLFWRARNSYILEYDEDPNDIAKMGKQERIQYGLIYAGYFPGWQKYDKKQLIKQA